MAKHALGEDTYNAAADLIGRNLEAGHGDKPAFIDVTGAHTYDEVDRLSNKAANLLTYRGLRMEDRVLMAMLDTVDFPVVFLGAIKAGIVPIPVNTRLTAADYDFMLEDSRARVLVVSEPILEQFLPHIKNHRFLQTVIVAGADGHGFERLSDVLEGQADNFEVAPTRRDDMCFWQA